MNNGNFQQLDAYENELLDGIESWKMKTIAVEEKKHIAHELIIASKKHCWDLQKPIVDKHYTQKQKTHLVLW